MARYWTTTHRHDYPWETVASAYWRRYPNPHSKHVFSEDFLEFRLLDDGRLYTRRLLTKTNKLPSWGRHLFSQKRVPLVEEAIADPGAKTLTTYTRNIALRYFMGTTERVVFSPDGDSTCVRKEVWIESGVFGLQAAITKFGVDRFKRNCVRATEGFDWVLQGKSARRKYSDKVASPEDEGGGEGAKGGGGVSPGGTQPPPPLATAGVPRGAAKYALPS